MRKEYLNDEVLEILIKKEVMLGSRYKIGEVGDYVYFFKIGDEIEINKVKIGDYRCEILDGNCRDEIEVEELIYLFEINMNYLNNENEFYDNKNYNYDELILDADNVIIDFNRKGEKNEEN